MASTIEANKKLNDEVIALRKEMSRNRNQIKSQEKVIKVLEGNLKSIIARYSTMNEKLTLLQEELGIKHDTKKPLNACICGRCKVSFQPKRKEMYL